MSIEERVAARLKKLEEERTKRIQETLEAEETNKVRTLLPHFPPPPPLPPPPLQCEVRYDGVDGVTEGGLVDGGAGGGGVARCV